MALEKKNQYDCVFVYEVKNRELDNILLLKNELEYRGYSAKLVEIWAEECHRSIPPESEVIVTFALHNQNTMKYVSQFVKGGRKFVNLQWEQVFTNGDRSQDPSSEGTAGVYGPAKQGMHICWGENTAHYLIDRYGVKKSHTALTGSITLDYLRKEFRDFYISREDLCRQYGIDPEQQLYLFISSFSYGELPDSLLNSEVYKNQGFDVFEHKRITIESQKEILDWFEKELIKHPDVTVVYRPHPTESSHKRLLEMEQKYPNFRVIGELSIKQWILSADKLYTWWSTSIAEIYAAKKGCSILRPVEMPYENELEVYKGANFVSDFDEFDCNYLLPAGFPVPEATMNHFYVFQEKRPAFLNVADVIEEVIKSDEFIVSGFENERVNPLWIRYFNLRRSLKKFLFSQPVLYRIAEYLFHGKTFANEHTLEDIRNEFPYFEEMKQKNLPDEAEVKEKEKMIRSMVAPFHENS